MNLLKGHSRLSLLAGALALAASAAFAEPAIEAKAKVEPGGLYELVFNPADQDVYVAAVGVGDAPARIVRLDGDTLERKGEIDVSEYPFFGIALNAQTQTLYGTSTRLGVLSVVDLESGAVVANLFQNLEDRAHLRQIAVDEAANKIYATVVGRSEDAANEVWVVDGASNTLERVIPVETGGAVTGLALDPARNQLFLTDMNENQVFVLDLAGGAVTQRWASGAENAINVAFDSAGDRLFVAHQGTGVVTVLDASSGELIETVPAGEGALSVVYAPQQDRIYVSNRRSGTTSVIDGGDYTVLANIETGTLPQTVAVDHATGRVYVTNKAQGVPRGSPPGTLAPEDPDGDTVVLFRP